MVEPPQQPPPPPPDDPDAARTAVESGPPPEEAQPQCRNCGAPHDPFQEYCLECGARLVPPAPARWSVWRRESWTRDSPFWFWAAFLGLLAIALVTAAVVVAATRDDRDAAPPPEETTVPTGILTETLTDTAAPVPTIPTDTVLTDTAITGTTPTPTFPTPTDTTDTTTQPIPTTPQPTPPPSPTPPPPPPTPTPPPSPGTLTTWPAGRTAYTVIVGSFQEARGRGPAEQRARQAQNARLDQVGILRSSDFSSLRPGWYAVFTGIFDTRSQAMSRLSTARASGFPTAYLRHVRP